MPPAGAVRGAEAQASHFVSTDITLAREGEHCLKGRVLEIQILYFVSADRAKRELVNLFF